jgi:para-nitrobenzyl esterase
MGERDPIYGTPTDQWATDASFRCGSVAQLAWHSAAGNPPYQFEFARVPPAREAWEAIHASELNICLGRSTERSWAASSSAAERGGRAGFRSDAAILDQFRQTGNPNGGCGFTNIHAIHGCRSQFAASRFR